MYRYKCHFCPNTFEDAKGRASHCNKAHKGQQAPKVVVTPPPLDKRYVCQQCPEFFPSEISRKNHERWHGADETQKCPHCTFSCKTPKTITKHLKSHFRTNEGGGGGTEFGIVEAMEKPSVTDWGKDHVHLEWQPPANDGGAQLEAYVVEKKDATTGKWVEAIRVSADQTKATVRSLREGEQYQFRVKAINKAGEGEPSDPTEPKTAKPRVNVYDESIERKPVIKWKPQKFECEAGKEKRIKVPFEVKGTRRGDPKPILLRNGKPVYLNKMEDLVEVIINGTVAEIVFKDPQKSDAGKWSLKLENTGGVSTEAAFELVVKGKPKTPKGQVDTLDVTSDSCAFLRGANEESQQLFDEMTAEMALRRANAEHELRPNDEHETESSDVDEDEYVVESDDDIPAVEHRSSVDMRRESLAEILDLGTSGTPARIGASLFPGKREERWVDPLPEKLQFQQQKNKIAELKCKYSRANAKVRWYKGRKELFSDGLKYKILIDKQSVTLIINNPDPDDSGKYTCKANEMPTNSFVTVEGPSINYVFLTPLPNTMEIYRTKQGILTCKLNSARAPLVWQRDDEKPIDVHDPRYQIEKDAAGCFTLTIRVVEQIDQGMWTATVNKNVISKCQVYVVEDPRDTFVVPEQLRNETAANEVGQSTPEIVALLNLSMRFDVTFERRRRHAMNPIQHSQLSDDGAGTSMTSDVSVQDYASSEFDLNAFLQICGQTEVQTWTMLGELSSFGGWSKIGEGAFGEVFKGTLENAPIAFKVIPFAASEEQCSKLVNGENLKPAKFIFNELYITNELSKLSAGNDFVTPTFIQLRMSKIIKGCFPSKLLKAWDAFKKAKPEKVENKRPDTYSEEGLHFLIIGLSYGGIDLKAYTIPNSHVCYSIFLQIALSLAVAERVLGFEHRDLHDENFLLEECAPDEKIRYKYDGAKIDVVSHGVRVSIIDYSISRLQKENVVVYADLSQDPGLFEQNGEEDGGDYQYDVYRMMKAAISDDGWASFCPQTNLYWLDYAAKKLFNNRFIRREKKEVIRGLFCPQYQNKFKTTRDFTVDPKFLTVFAKYISK
ncbi:hypothetical protein niasHT_025385 [Heterodera trifolii]|uniref:non-specific serine/threonine protein kinase n=1 Tax=Heterodera trifolii TaxID=157864 RepID=A0ABD2KEN4_9BILA